MNDQELLEDYCRLARALAEMFEPLLETVVHDLRNPEQAIIAIYNSEITGRKIGDPTTDLGVKRIEDRSVPDEIINYENESPGGQRLKSSSIAIRNSDGELIGSLCLNLDISFFSQIGKFIEQFTQREKTPHIKGAEKFSGKSVEEELKDALERIQVERNLQSKVLSNADKKTIIQDLRNQGYFSLRGAVTIVSKQLELTRPSVYKYMNSD